MLQGNLDLLRSAMEGANAVMSKVDVKLPLDETFKDPTLRQFLDMHLYVAQIFYLGLSSIATVTANVPPVVVDHGGAPPPVPPVMPPAPAGTTPVPAAAVTPAPGTPSLISSILSALPGAAKP